MKKFISLIIAILFIIAPTNAGATIEGYKIVAKSSKDNITLYARKMSNLYGDFKIDFKGTTYSRPFWISEANNPTYAPQIIYEDINKDKKKELIIILTRGYGTGIIDEEVHVFNTDNNNFGEILVDHPLAIIYKNVKTKLSTKKAEVSIGNKKSTVDLSPLKIDPTNIFEDIAFGGSVFYEVKDNQLIVTVSGQITPGRFVGEIVIVYEYRDKMYQAKSIEFHPKE